jgi:hypothetical protein
MRSRFLGYVIAVTVGLAASSNAFAQPKNRGKAAAPSADKTMDKQMEWENKVMGDDHAKASDMRKIAAAQKLADEAAKNPPPVPAPKVKDPNKEGVRAKQEAAIGLPIASDNPVGSARKAGNFKKAAAPKSSADDELGALVASSLAEEKAPPSETRGSGGIQVGASRHAKAHGPRASGANARAKGRPKSGAAPGSLDSMFAATK